MVQLSKQGDNMKDTICELLGISKTSYYRWKNDRQVIQLLEKYFTKEDLLQFLHEGRIDKLEAKNSEDSDLNEFYTNSAVHKLITKSTLSMDEADQMIIKFFKAILNKNKRYSILPLKSFLIILNLPQVTNTTTLIDEVEKSSIKDNWKKIIIKFSTYELSRLEINALVENKIKVTKYFENEKLDKNCMLNFS